MRLGIDASNLRSGGSFTHLTELLSAARPERYGIDRVFVWGGREILSRLPRRRWLEPVHETLLDAALPARAFWQQTRLARLARNAACDLLFVPGSTYLGDFRPFVTMSRNMLPFDLSQVRLFGASPRALKFLLLRLAQLKTFRNATGVIFLDVHARSRVMAEVGRLGGRHVIIRHGVASRFRLAPRRQRELSFYTPAEPLKLLYVSTVDAYKHQWHVVEAVEKLLKARLPVRLDIVGPAHTPSLKRLRATIQRLGASDYVRYVQEIPYAEMPATYTGADVFVFASSCENLPNVLLEAMSAGLPIACSNHSPMPNILGDGGVYFDPEDPEEIAAALRQLIESLQARERCAAVAYERGQLYTWERCAEETFSFLRDIAQSARLKYEADTQTLTDTEQLETCAVIRQTKESA